MIRLVLYLAGTSQTLTPPSCCTFIQQGFHLKPPHLYIFTIFEISLFTLCTLFLIFTHFYSTHFTIHLITYFYVRWPGLHPNLVFVISFSHYKAVCVSISSVHLSRLVFPIHIAYHPFASLFWPQFPIFTPLFSSFYSSSVLISMLGFVILLLEFHRSSADFMFIWSLLLLVILPDWVFSFILIVL